jgi:hypothetical protein
MTWRGTIRDGHRLEVSPSGLPVATGSLSLTLWQASRAAARRDSVSQPLFGRHRRRVGGRAAALAVLLARRSIRIYYVKDHPLDTVSREARYRCGALTPGKQETDTSRIGLSPAQPAG